MLTAKNSIVMSEEKKNISIIITAIIITFFCVSKFSLFGWLMVCRSDCGLTLLFRSTAMGTSG